jgi:hypothetical protein
MRAPEFIGCRRLLDQLRGTARQLTTADGPMAEHITHAITQLIAHLGDAFVGCAAMRAIVAAVFDQSDFRA